MSNENAENAENADNSSDDMPKRVGKVTRGLPKWLQDGQFVMVFGGQRPPNALSSVETAASENKHTQEDHDNPPDSATSGSNAALPY